MNIRSIPWALRRRLTGHLLKVRHNSRVSFASAPVVEGLWPQLNAAGVMKFGLKCMFRSFRLRPSLAVLQGGMLQVGDYVFLNDGVTMCASTAITIGSHVMIADMVYIYDTDFHCVTPGARVRQAPVSIGNNVWICANSMILAGATVGDHSVVAAGSIVTGNVPARAVVAGRPARVIRTFEAPVDWIRSREPA